MQAVPVAADAEKEKRISEIFGEAEYGMRKRCFSILLIMIMCLGMIQNASIYCAAEEKVNSLTLQYNSAGDIFETYVTKNAEKAKLLCDKELYSYDIATQTFTLEYTFPDYGIKDVYICEESGLLYFGYWGYENQKDSANVIVYNLENGSVNETISVEGYHFSSVGADAGGRIYLAVYAYDSEEKKVDSLLLLSDKGEVLDKAPLFGSVDGFSGFCEGGTFYYIDSVIVYSAYGYANLMGRLMNGTCRDNKISLNENYMTYAKNIYFANYRRPVEIEGPYLVTFSGGFYPLEQITDTSWSCALSVTKELEMGSEYSYIYNIGINTVIEGNTAYTLYDNDTVFAYDLKTKEKLGVFHTGNKVFNMKKCGDNLIALERDGNSFFYELIDIKKMEKIETKYYSLNEAPAYKGRTKAAIVKRFSESVSKDYDGTPFLRTGSDNAPYSEYILTEETKTEAVRISNYYRWLAGLTPLESLSDNSWSDAGKGAILLSASEFSHTPEQPEDMDDSFYEAAYRGTSGSSIAYNWIQGKAKIIDSIRQFLDDDGYTMPGHRNTFFTRNGTGIAYGMTPYYLCQTVSYKDNPNPMGTAAVGNNDEAYSWPPAGYFPAEEISTEAYWTVNLNTDKLNLSETGLEVVITDLDTGEQFVRDSAENGLSASSFWGFFISFAPPETAKDSYNGKKYQIQLKNLADKDGLPAELDYTVEFFSYGDKVVLDGTEYFCSRYGALSEGLAKGDVDANNKVSAEDALMTLKQVANMIELSGREFDAADVNRNGKVDAEDALKILKYVAGMISEL